MLFRCSKQQVLNSSELRTAGSRFVPSVKVVDTAFGATSNTTQISKVNY